MKKITLLSILFICTSSLCFAQKNIYSFEGISFNKKGISVRHQRLQDEVVQITGTAGYMSIIIQKSKSDGKSAEKFLEEILETTMDNEMENRQSNASKGKLNVIGGITDSNINGIEAKHIDFRYNQGMGWAYQRQYCFVKGDYRIYMVITGTVKPPIKHFPLFMKTFSFNPE
ncbi:MAG: hypothetical protein FWC41_12615 [Firmicutes bacterium]|nr:hypothetical protein [Bacillota bacterium]